MLIYSALFLFPLFLYFLSLKKKNKTRSRMEKMMLTMGGAMLVGMTIGLYIGGILHGSFFLSLLLSVIITVVVGLLIGLPHGALATIEGIFTGGMAGLMGAMTAEMLSIPEIRIFLLLLFLLMGLGSFWSSQFWIKTKDERGGVNTMLMHITTMVYLLFVTFIFIWYPPFVESVEPSNHEEHSTNQDT